MFPFVDVPTSFLRAALTGYAFERLRIRGIMGSPSSDAVESLPSVPLSAVAEPASEGLSVKSSSAMSSLAKPNSGEGVVCCSDSVSHHASSAGEDIRSAISV